MTTSITTIAAFFTVVLLFAAARVTEAQPPCAQALMPCYAALNGTAPTSTCCTAMRTVFTTQLPCLCNLFNNPGLISSLNINVQQALQIPSRCNLSNDTSVCSASAPGPSPPPGGSGRNNGVGTISWTAMPAILMVWAITCLY